MTASRSIPDKDPLGNHAMHALADIDHLRNPAVSYHGSERVRLLATQRHDLLRGEPMNGLLHGDLRRLVQIPVVSIHNNRAEGLCR